jgi:hypothetical protein
MAVFTIYCHVLPVRSIAGDCLLAGRSLAAPSMDSQVVPVNASLNQIIQSVVGNSFRPSTFATLLLLWKPNVGVQKRNVTKLAIVFVCFGILSIHMPKQSLQFPDLLIRDVVVHLENREMRPL